jgi:hypothetical protein
MKQRRATSGSSERDRAVHEAAVWRIGPNETAARAFNDARPKSARGRFFVGEPVAMRRPAKVSLDRMKFPLTLAGGLRTTFADVISTPRRLAALVRRLKADRDER